MKSNIIDSIISFLHKIFGLNKGGTESKGSTLEELIKIYKKYPYPVEFIPDHLIIYYKPEGSRRSVYDKIKALFPDFEGSDPDSVSVCKCCENIELVKYPNVHLYAHLERTRPVSGSTTGVGEDEDAYYFLNFITTFPIDEKDSIPSFKIPKMDVNYLSNQSEEIIIAVLDNGIDDSEYLHGRLWKSSNGQCGYPDGINGWNFVDGNHRIFDGESSHGNLVSSFILEQFLENSDVSVSPKLMTIKVLGPNNKGNLMDFICALCFAKSFGANIINASLGFYINGFTPGAPRSNEQREYPLEAVSISKILSQLIVNDLRKENIIFVAASGNRLDSNEVFMQNSTNGNTRNLNDNPFYFANLGDTEPTSENNIFTFTTVGNQGSRLTVADTQNFSPDYVDFGVLSDDNDFGFKIPFSYDGTDMTVKGSSYAAAVGTGKLASLSSISAFRNVSSLKKEDMLNSMSERPENDPDLIGIIKEGKYFER